MNNILLGIFFLILGLLFMNMLTNICGCKDLVEGLCTDGEGRCVWSYSVCPIDDFIFTDTAASSIARQESMNQICNGNSSVLFRTNDAAPIGPPSYGSTTNWKNSSCCINDPELTPLSGGDNENPPTGTYKLSCNNGQITFTPSQL